jgi:hypothetical protein
VFNGSLSTFISQINPDLAKNIPPFCWCKPGKYRSKIANGAVKTNLLGIKRLLVLLIQLKYTYLLISTISHDVVIINIHKNNKHCGYIKRKSMVNEMTNSGPCLCPQPAGGKAKTACGGLAWFMVPYAMS